MSSQRSKKSNSSECRVLIILFRSKPSLEMPGTFESSGADKIER